MKKNVWLINQYNTPPELGHHNRHYNFAKYLHKKQYTPTLFIGSFLHNSNKQMITENLKYKKYENEFDVYFIKTNSYFNNKIKRILAMIEFYFNTYKLSKKLKKPDIILGSSAHPLSAILAVHLSRKYNCQCIVEIRDLWPESLIEYGILSRDSLLARILKITERKLYEKADKIVFTMQGGKDYIVKNKWDTINGGKINLDKVYYINNGIDLEDFDKDIKENKYFDSDLENKDNFKVVYSGSIRLVNNIKKIVDVAEIIQSMHSNIEFFIFGEGNELSVLKSYCEEKNIKNIHFKGFVNKKFIPSILSSCDLNIFHFANNNLKEFGGSLNKLFDYFASGKPTISDCEFKYDLIIKYNSGKVIDNASALELALLVEEFYNMSPLEYKRMSFNARIAAKDYDYTNLTSRLIEAIEK